MTVHEYMEHLRRHYDGLLMRPESEGPAVIGQECLDALKRIEEKYGDEIALVAGLEVRLGQREEAVDYILSVLDDSVPPIETQWLEFDYEHFREDGSLAPCVFINTEDLGLFVGGDYRGFLAFSLPSLVGKSAAKKLSVPFARLADALPEGAVIKQVASLAARGMGDMLRLVIQVADYEGIFALLAAAKWPRDISLLRAALSPWKNEKCYAVCLDLTESGVTEKVGFEVIPAWQNPNLADKFLARLEAAGLCLPEKREAVRRWALMRPDGKPFLQASILYYKLSYRDRKIYEAKAYLQQMNMMTHHYYRAFDRPILMEMELSDEEGRTLPIEDALFWIGEAVKNRVRRVKFYGGTRYPELSRLLTECREKKMAAGIYITAQERDATRNLRERLEEMVEQGATEFYIEMGEETETYLAALQSVNEKRKDAPAAVICVWPMDEEHADGLSRTAGIASRYGATSLLVTAPASAHGELWCRCVEQLSMVADFIEGYAGQMRIFVDSCFSPLRAFMRKKENVGISKGCGAGRDRFAVSVEGKPKPCRLLQGAGANRRIRATSPALAHPCASAEDFSDLGEYWECSPILSQLRAVENHRQEPCASCDLRRSCLPCQVEEG